MIDSIKKSVYGKYKKEDKKGIFFSGFSKGKILFSNGIIHTDTELENVINQFYNGIIKKHEGNIYEIVVDVVLELEEVKEQDKILKIDLKKYGILLISRENEESGLVLPNMSGVEYVKDALSLIKQKDNLSGKIDVYKFSTDRIVV